eukprot:m.31551 g.31551  ORF g.31551 m.31551 type:complete len:73 (-) comp9430_c0_seq1:97-315(-)
MHTGLSMHDGSLRFAKNDARAFIVHVPTLQLRVCKKKKVEQLLTCSAGIIKCFKPALYDLRRVLTAEDDTSK